MAQKWNRTLFWDLAEGKLSWETLSLGLVGCIDTVDGHANA